MSDDNKNAKKPKGDISSETDEKARVADTPDDDPRGRNSSSSNDDE